MDDRTEEFWDRLEDINAGMLGVAPEMRFMPMSHNVDDDDPANVLWFITAKGTDLTQSLTGGAQDGVYIVSDGGKALYARINGRLSLSDDRAKLDELWNAVAASWFEDGKQDEDVQLVRMDLTEAEVWATGGTLSFLYQIAKSKVTGEKPDMGDHFTLTF